MISSISGLQSPRPPSQRLHPLFAKKDSLWTIFLYLGSSKDATDFQKICRYFRDLTHEWKKNLVIDAVKSLSNLDQTAISPKSKERLIQSIEKDPILWSILIDQKDKSQANLIKTIASTLGKQKIPYLLATNSETTIYNHSLLSTLLLQGDNRAFKEKTMHLMPVRRASLCLPLAEKFLKLQPTLSESQKRCSIYLVSFIAKGALILQELDQLELLVDAYPDIKLKNRLYSAIASTLLSKKGEVWSWLSFHCGEKISNPSLKQQYMNRVISCLSKRVSSPHLPTTRATYLQIMKEALSHIDPMSKDSTAKKGAFIIINARYLPGRYSPLLSAMEISSTMSNPQMRDEIFQAITTKLNVAGEQALLQKLLEESAEKSLL